MIFGVGVVQFAPPVFNGKATRIYVCLVAERIRTLMKNPAGQRLAKRMNMKTKTFVLGTLLTLGAVVASAQEAPTTPKYEVGANYTYTRVNPGGNLGSYNTNGGSAYFEYNLNKVVGLVADLGAT